MKENSFFSIFYVSLSKHISYRNLRDRSQSQVSASEWLFKGITGSGYWFFNNLLRCYSQEVFNKFVVYNIVDNLPDLTLFIKRKNELNVNECERSEIRKVFAN